MVRDGREQKIALALTFILTVGMTSPALAARARINVYNDTSDRIKVVMDTNREVHHIESGGVKEFKKARIGDQPTFRCYRDGVIEGEPFAVKKVKRVITSDKHVKINCP